MTTKMFLIPFLVFTLVMVVVAISQVLKALFMRMESPVGAAILCTVSAILFLAHSILSYMLITLLVRQYG